ncbi:hypothetical protein JCM5353_004988 [Sporobolomyces roseus]
MPQIAKSVLPQDSLVLVTGANGYIGSHIVEQLLAFGFRVRGAVRSASKVSGLQERWESKFPGKFEVVEVPDFAVDGAYDEAAKGVDAIAHVASSMIPSPSYENTVEVSVKGILNALRAAAANSSVKRFVLTSSTVAAGVAQAGAPRETFDESSWFKESISYARSLPEDNPMKPGMNYLASKTASEVAAWEFVKTEKPSFTLNTILPSVAVGEILDPSSQLGSTGKIGQSSLSRTLSLYDQAKLTVYETLTVKDLYTGESDVWAKSLPLQNLVPVRDTALLHVGALTLPSVSNTRLFATAHSANWNDVLAIFRKLYPGKEYKDFEGQATEFSTYKSEKSLEVLKELGQQGWTDMEITIKQLVAPFA